MLKYPRLYNPNRFMKILEYYKREYENPFIYVQPKYDGSNMTVYKRQWRSRNLNELDEGLSKLLRKAIPKKQREIIEDLSEKYQLYIEAGGKRYAPGRHIESWTKDYEYIIIDVYDHEKQVFIDPAEACLLIDERGLKYVDTVVLDTEYLNNWQDKLKMYSKYEGFVVKIDIPTTVVEDLWRKFRHRQQNRIMGKFKHEYVNIPEDRKQYLEDSEIIAEIERVLNDVGDEDHEKFFRELMKAIEKEAEERGKLVPSKQRINSLYIEYKTVKEGIREW